MSLNNRKVNRVLRILLSLFMLVMILPSSGTPRSAALSSTEPVPVLSSSEPQASKTAEAGIVRDKDYIVHFRENCVSNDLNKPDGDGVPFEVISGRELQSLLKEDCIEWFEEDGEAFLFEEDTDAITETPDGGSEDVASDYYNDEQWHLAMIGAEKAARNNYLGQGVRVGVLDSGVSPHPDLADRLLKGYNYMDNVSDPENTTDQYGHGTKVAGLVAAYGEEGQIGSAPMAEIVPLKCTDGKTVKISTICRAIYGAVDDYDCDVINMSFGVKTDYQTMREAVSYAEEKQVVMVSAVGNSGKTDKYYPAAYDKVIGVGSVDREENWYYHSNYNNSVYLTAPGVEVRSTGFRGGYEYGTGCSFAIPQVAGAAAVMLGIDSTLIPEQIREIFAETARDKGSKGYDEYYGYGIPDIGACAEAVAGSGGGSDDPDPPDPPCDGGPDCALRAFSDLDSSAWYHESIHYVLKHSIMNGYGEGLFGPDDSISRAMIVVMLWRMDGEPKTDPDIRFHDVEPGRWYTDAVIWAAGKGITSGLSADTFAPDQPVTREQFMTFLYRFAVYKGEDVSAGEAVDLSRFNDKQDVSAWAETAVRWAVGSGILQGTDEMTLSPKDMGSRAQAAAVFMRYDRCGQ